MTKMMLSTLSYRYCLACSAQPLTNTILTTTWVCDDWPERVRFPPTGNRTLVPSLIAVEVMSVRMWDKYCFKQPAPSLPNYCSFHIHSERKMNNLIPTSQLDLDQGSLSVNTIKARVNGLNIRRKIMKIFRKSNSFLFSSGWICHTKILWWNNTNSLLYFCLNFSSWSRWIEQQ